MVLPFTQYYYLIISRTGKKLAREKYLDAEKKQLAAEERVEF